MRITQKINELVMWFISKGVDSEPGKLSVGKLFLIWIEN